MDSVKLLLMAVATALCCSASAAKPPAPYGPIPSDAQLFRQTNDFYGFLHFSVNTFTGREWGNGDESESVFNPRGFDPRQIVRTAKMAGMKGLVLTCKHHDGFCLWPSAYTTHSVKYSSWENGNGDVVKAIAAACRKYGLKFGVYLSPWDRNNAAYGKPEYLLYYRHQLRELLTEYGPIYEVWFDGANGGTGYYGGAREKRTIDNHTYYDWNNTWQLVRQLQPWAVMFSDAGPDLRWVGNEHGIAGDPCWETVDPTGWCPGNADAGQLFHGLRPEKPTRALRWIPAECDVSIRPGWFYHPEQDNQVKSPRDLLDIYYQSIGHGAVLLLNIPPDRNGQIHSNDVASLRQFRHILDQTFARNLAGSAVITASNIRGHDQRFGPKNVLDNDLNTYWSPDDGATNASLTLQFRKPVTFDVIRLREYLPLGQRVDTFALDQWRNGHWEEFSSGTSIGSCRLLRIHPITCAKIRVRFSGPVPPAISDFGLFAQPFAAR